MRLFERMPNWTVVELHQLAGDGSTVSMFRELRIAIGELITREANLITGVDCETCNQPPLQQLVGRTRGGETCMVLPCTSCRLDLKEAP